MSTAVHLGLDIGGTASRWVAVNETGVEVAQGKTSGATAHLFNPAEKLRITAAFEAITAEVTAAGYAVQSLTVGMTGFGSAVRDDMLVLVSGIFALPSDAIVLIDDIVLAYMGAFAPGEGHLISAGTGSIGVHIAAGDAPSIRVGGRGILIDDGGSGSWIALRALDALYRQIDRLGPAAEASPLGKRMFELVGGQGWDFVRSFVYAGDRGRIGQLAVGVARAADDGDEIARGILVRAGQELAALGEALIARVGRRPVGYVGGVLNLHPIIFDTIRASLPGSDVTRLETNAALTAARLQSSGDAAWKATLTHKPTLG
ncbi:BadF/BadG/BcrA/BcrD ATPase family protein [Devosia sp. MC1541]|uniref:N-acetylglucosamine kinase n=1 Tax=Devosia sp. MC1541 TaxID=2725264 RepID=UPI00145CE720|nr:BadF/BadG/BcrA/BcrD ATPase family protein [Devosia sp. MC1541]